jgi:mycothiol synthase
VTASIRPCGEHAADLAAYAAVANATDPAFPTSVDQLRWEAATYPGGRRFLAEERGRVVGVGSTGRIYMYAPTFELAWLFVGVLPEARRRGTGTALWAACSVEARKAGRTGFQAEVDGTSAGGIAFLGHHGFTEVDRARAVRLDLAGLPIPDRVLPEGVSLTTLAARPDLLPDVHAVAVAAFPDIPGETPIDPGDLAAFTARDVERPGVPHDAFVIALNDRTGEVLGYASLLLVPGSAPVAWHDMTAVLPSARGRGIARSMKTETIRWAIANGLDALDTGNDVANAAMRAVNARLGYRPLPDRISFRGPLHGDTRPATLHRPAP